MDVLGREIRNYELGITVVVSANNSKENDFIVAFITSVLTTDLAETDLLYAEVDKNKRPMCKLHMGRSCYNY